MKDEAVVAQALRDPASLPGRLRATLAVLEAVTSTPAAVDGAIAAARAEGLSDAALEDALYVCAMFNVMDRMADALGFDPATASAPELFLNFGYAGMLRRVLQSSALP